jgi:lipoprotein NlpI
MSAQARPTMTDARRSVTLADLAVAGLSVVIALAAPSAQAGRACSPQEAWPALVDCMPVLTDHPRGEDSPSGRYGIDLAANSTAAPEFSDIQNVRLDRSNVGVHRHANVVHQAKTDATRTLDRYSKIIKHDPADDDAYFRRGIAYFYEGLPFKARTDIRMARKLDPDYAYYAIWLDIVNHRSHRESHLAQVAARLDMTQWPSPVIRLFLGQLDPDAVFSAAADESETIEKEQMCEANFYVGELALRQGTTDEAERRFQAAASDCPPDFVEGPAARAELHALGTGPH